MGRGSAKLLFVYFVCFVVLVLLRDLRASVFENSVRKPTDCRPWDRAIVENNDHDIKPRNTRNTRKGAQGGWSRELNSTEKLGQNTSEIGGDAEGREEL